MAASAASTPAGRDFVTVSGTELTIDDVVDVARHGLPVRLSDDRTIHARMEASCQYIADAVAHQEPLYGVTTGFGGMSDVVIAVEDAAALQNNMMWYHKCGAGKRLAPTDVRAAMLVRMNSHLHGISGVRLELVRRLETFLNAGVTPHVREFGSIGASGDLVPLSSIAGALTGVDRCFTVDFGGEEMDALSALDRLGLPPLQLLPKEGLAMINGTSMMTGIAALVLYDVRRLLALTMGVHALAFQALQGSNQAFHAFIHAHKPHRGQEWAARQMRDLLAASRMIRDEMGGQHDYRVGDLIQDRYSLRCLPQYLGPLVEGLAQADRQITVELNSATDNPLIDSESAVSYHGGNFLGQYVGVAMDHTRYYIGLLAKHLDVQLALLVTPEFSHGLAPSLVGNPARTVNMGLKALQVTANSIVPVLEFLGNSLADRFPTHAEQFNQNINSQGFGSATLARQSIEAFEQYMAIALIFGVQAVDLRAYRLVNHYDARACLSPASVDLYEAVREVVGRPPAPLRPYLWDDDEQALEAHIAALVADIQGDGRVVAAMAPVRATLRPLDL